MYGLLGILFICLPLYILGRKDPLERDKGVQKKMNIREERERRLEKPLRKMLERDSQEQDQINDPTKIIRDLKRVSRLSVDREVEDWLKGTCRDSNELIKVFQIFMQRGLNQGRTHLTRGDVSYISEHMDLKVINADPNPDIGTIHTLGLVHGKVQRVKIYCAAIPVSKGRGSVTSVEGVSIHYPPLEKQLKHFDLYLKFYPEIPENYGEWEAALILAIYGALTQRVLPVDIVLGGINPQGRLLPPSPKVIEELEKESIIISDDIKGDVFGGKSLAVNHVKNIQEIIKMMETPPELEYNRKQRDFLSDS